MLGKAGLFPNQFRYSHLVGFLFCHAYFRMFLRSPPHPATCYHRDVTLTFAGGLFGEDLMDMPSSPEVSLTWLFSLAVSSRRVAHRDLEKIREVIVKKAWVDCVFLPNHFSVSAK